MRSKSVQSLAGSERSMEIGSLQFAEHMWMHSGKLDEFRFLKQQKPFSREPRLSEASQAILRSPNNIPHPLMRVDESSAFNQVFSQFEIHYRDPEFRSLLLFPDEPEKLENKTRDATKVAAEGETGCGARFCGKRQKSSTEVKIFRVHG
jgi:hypothetical protein